MWAVNLDENAAGRMHPVYAPRPLGQRHLRAQVGAHSEPAQRRKHPSLESGGTPALPLLAQELVGRAKAARQIIGAANGVRGAQPAVHPACQAVVQLHGLGVCTNRLPHPTCLQYKHTVCVHT